MGVDESKLHRRISIITMHFSKRRKIRILPVDLHFETETNEKVYKVYFHISFTPPQEGNAIRQTIKV